MPFCTAKTMLEKGIHLEFFLNFCDNVFTEIMVKEGKYYYCPDIKVDHQHWVNKGAQPDATYAVAQAKFTQDQDTYYKVKKQLGLLGPRTRLASWVARWLNLRTRLAFWSARRRSRANVKR